MRLRRQRVGRLAGLVEDQPGEAAGFALDAPVFEFSHVALFTKICCRPPGAMADDGRPRIIIHMQGEAGAVMA
jgi:hypothetical protein